MSPLQFKRRLALLITATKGSQRQFAREMEKNGNAVHFTTINKWLDERSPTVPNVVDLICISQIEPQVSVDFLIGRRAAETVTEKFIEERMK